MKPRHAAALALVGWYLMVPPLGPDHTRDDSLPLARWHTLESFDSALECRDFHSQAWERSKSNNNAKMAEAYESATCIASDDPRLKPK
jgi:hypothetical protein